MTGATEFAPVLLTAFLAGLLGSGHCFGMCGGIAGSLGALGTPGPGAARWVPGLLFNLGRIFSYIALGCLGAWLLGGLGETLNVPHWARILRGLTAAIILLIGLRFLFDLRLLDRLERAGGRLWRLVQPTAVRLSSRGTPLSRLLLGGCWGLLPCGLVYSALLLAIAGDDPLRAGFIMAAFGAGTLPSMLGLTWMSPLLQELVNDPVVRRTVGACLILLAFWTLFMMLAPRGHGPH